MDRDEPDGTRVVYRRTLKGQFAVTGASDLNDDTLDSVQRRLLMLVNGFTTLYDIARVARFQVCAEEAALVLKARGLIESLTQHEPPDGSLHFMRAIGQGG
jgi:CHASE2 domain-containing sensor protein